MSQRVRIGVVPLRGRLWQAQSNARSTKALPKSKTPPLSSSRTSPRTGANPARAITSRTRRSSTTPSVEWVRTCSYICSDIWLSASPTHCSRRPSAYARCTCRICSPCRRSSTSSFRSYAARSSTTPTRGGAGSDHTLRSWALPSRSSASSSCSCRSNQCRTATSTRLCSCSRSRYR